ncbi:uncharacterized protein [Aegilops tauschii subsp. strangulata]|uniref:uncharacterized protein n=1 Tax=Aegilops tauschii subsp. strangulata TaxID=200361 RepID=UPI00098B6B89|nr:uncharacterized protein LOC109785541 [Aegilops tauschii subsp. strangulata]
MAKPSAAKGLNGSDRWSSVEPEDDREDRLSSLPDDVLLNVVERLGIAGATRTGILSGRWRRIPGMISKLRLAVGSSDPERDRSKLSCVDDVVRANAAMAEAIRSMPENRSTGPYAVRLLCLQFFLGHEDIAVGQAIADTMSMEDIGLAELTLLTRKDGRRCADQDLVNYGGQMRLFVYACPNTLFTGLARLKLENLRLPESESDFPKILGMCERLEFLRLYNCDAGIKSSLQVEHHQLRELEIIKSGFERVDLTWLPELRTLTLSCWKSHHDPMSFSHVRLLHTVTMSNTAASYHKMLRLSEFLGMAIISNLHLNFESEKIWIKPEGPEECFFPHSSKNVLLSCQDRKKLQLSEEKKDAGTEWESSSASDFKHHNLAVLRVFGFQLQDKFVNYVNGVMESAADLKGLYLYKRPRCGACVCKMRKDGYPWTEKQKVSLLNRFNMDACPLLTIYFPSSRT